MPKTLQTQIERDILPWILSIKRAAHLRVQPALSIYRFFDFAAQVALVLGSIGISYPALDMIGSVVPAPIAAASSATTPSESTKPPNMGGHTWVGWMKEFAGGKHPGIALVLIMGWAVPSAYFKKYKFAERSVLVDSLQEEGRKLEKELLDALRTTAAAPGLVQGILQKVNNLVDAHISPRSYPDTKPLEAAEQEAEDQVKLWLAKFPDFPWSQELREH